MHLFHIDSDLLPDNLKLTSSELQEVEQNAHAKSKKVVKEKTNPASVAAVTVSRYYRPLATNGQGGQACLEGNVEAVVTTTSTKSIGCQHALQPLHYVVTPPVCQDLGAGPGPHQKGGGWEEKLH